MVNMVGYRMGMIRESIRTTHEMMKKLNATIPRLSRQVETNSNDAGGELPCCRVEGIRYPVCYERCHAPFSARWWHGVEVFVCPEMSYVSLYASICLAYREIISLAPLVAQLIA